MQTWESGHNSRDVLQTAPLRSPDLGAKDATMRVWEPCMMSLAVLRRRERPTGLCSAEGGALNACLCSAATLLWKAIASRVKLWFFSALPAMPQQ